MYKLRWMLNKKFTTQQKNSNKKIKFTIQKKIPRQKSNLQYKKKFQQKKKLQKIIQGVFLLFIFF